MFCIFPQLGMDTGNVDMAKTMAEVFSIGDINKDEKLSKVEFVQVRTMNTDLWLVKTGHVTSILNNCKSALKRWQIMD